MRFYKQAGGALERAAVARRGHPSLLCLTGGRWVPSFDSTKKKMKDACAALECRDAFALDGPPDCQPLPTSYIERKL
jgi:hypothetical protein